MELDDSELEPLPPLAASGAPVQVGFLGYPGTSGGGFLDYVIADAVVIPPGAEADW